MQSSPDLFPFIEAIAVAAEKSFDPAASLIFLPTRPNIHTEYLDTRKRHPIRESLAYALVLLETSQTNSLQLASTIIEKVLTYQETSDPESRLYGLWHYFAEESVQKWPFPDLNWADFNALLLLLIWYRHAQRFSEPLRTSIKQAIARSALCIRRRNVHLQYTNVAIKGTFVTLAAAELLEDESLFAYATERMRNLHCTIFASASFAEYNSPMYAAVCLGALMAIDHYVKDEPSRQLALEIQHRFWNHVAAHFHPATGEIAGPHSRAYSLTLRESPGDLGGLLHRASRGAVSYDFVAAIDKSPFAGLYGHLFEPKIPESALSCLVDQARSTEVRESTQIYSEGSSADITTYINPAFCLGSVNFQDGWEQRQNLIAYWPTARGLGLLKQEYLHDERPCCSGFFASDQRFGRVLAASFLGNFADHHVSFRTDHVTASFLGSIVKFKTGGEQVDIYRNQENLPSGVTQSLAEGDTIFLQLPSLAIAVKVLRHRTGKPADIPITISTCPDNIHIEFAHYRGESQLIRWSDFQYAHTYFALIAEKPPLHGPSWRQSILDEKYCVTETDEKTCIQWNDLSVSVPNDILTEEGVRTFFAPSLKPL